MIGTADKVIPAALLQSMALRAGARITDVNAGHLALAGLPDRDQHQAPRCWLHCVAGSYLTVRTPAPCHIGRHRRLLFTIY